MNNTTWTALYLLGFLASVWCVVLDAEDDRPVGVAIWTVFAVLNFIFLIGALA